jgi:hypothetical protein
MSRGFFVQVSPSADPQIDTSSDSCSIWSVTVRRQRNVRVALAEMSNAAPSPLASRRVLRDQLQLICHELPTNYLDGDDSITGENFG